MFIWPQFIPQPYHNLLYRGVAQRLLRYQFSELRMQSADTTFVEMEVAWSEGVRSYEAQHQAIDLRAQRLHQVVH